MNAVEPRPQGARPRQILEPAHGRLGAQLGVALGQPADRPLEGEPSRKVSYVKAVEGTPYSVLAGVYDDAATIEELQQISASSRGGRWS